MYTLNNVLPIEATSRNKPTARAHVHVNSRDTERPCNKREDISTETAMLEICKRAQAICCNTNSAPSDSQPAKHCKHDEDQVAISPGSLG